jgi:hypothetical protein
VQFTHTHLHPAGWLVCCALAAVIYDPPGARNVGSDIP